MLQWLMKKKDKSALRKVTISAQAVAGKKKTAMIIGNLNKRCFKLISSLKDEKLEKWVIVKTTGIFFF